MNKLLVLGLLLCACGPQATKVTPPAVLSFQWKKQLVDRSSATAPEELSQPFVDIETLYVSSSAGLLWALDKRTGRPLWYKDIGPLAAPVKAHHEGRVYAGTMDGTVVCLDKHDGHVYWEYRVKGTVERPVVIHKQMAIAATSADMVYGLDYLTGEFKWQYSADTPDAHRYRGHAGITAQDGIIYTGFSDGSVRALRAKTGRVTWSTSLATGDEGFQDVDTTPLLHKGQLLVASAAAGVASLDKETGLQQWIVPINGVRGLASDGKLLYGTSPEMAFALNIETGAFRWRQSTKGYGQPSPPAFLGPYVVYTLSHEGVVIANRRTGAPLQYFNPGSGVSAAPWLNDDFDLFFISNRGNLYAFHLRTYQ